MKFNGRVGFLMSVVFFAACSAAFAGQGPTPIKEVFDPAPPADPSRSGKVAVIQWNAPSPTPVGPEVTKEQAESFKQRNRATLAEMIREAASKGAKLILTPEFAVVNYPYHPNLPPEEDDFLNPDEIRPYVEPVPGPTTDYFGRLAASLGVYIHIAFAEVDRVDQKFYNAVVVLNPRGEIVHRYRKINLYRLENRFLSAGSHPAIYDNFFFGKIGVAVCADIYSGNPMATYAQYKVDAVALSTSWAVMDSGMSAFRSAAARARAFVLASNNRYFPDSGVINPDGSLQSWIRQSGGIAYGYLPLKSRAIRVK